MTRDEGNDILMLWKHDLCRFPPATITKALRATGDLVPVNAGQALERVTARRAAAADAFPGVIRVWHSAVAAGNSEVPA